MSETFRGGPLQQLAAGRWTLVPGATAAFRVRNLGVKKVRGTIPVRSAEVTIDDRGLVSAVQAVLVLAEIDTGNSRRDTDLAKPKLLDTQQFPLMTFSGGPESPGTGHVPGTLAAHGHTVALELAVTSEHPTTTDVSVRITTSLDRTEFGITAPSFMIGRLIEVDISATFRRW